MILKGKGDRAESERESSTSEDGGDIVSADKCGPAMILSSTKVRL